MDEETLSQIGLNKNQIKTYLALIRAGSLTPPELVKLVGCTRTNAYEILRQLEALGLALPVRSKTGKTYRPAHPTMLEKVIKDRRTAVLRQEQQLQLMLPQLLSFYYANSAQPGVRFFQGREGIIEVYKDMLRRHQTVYLIRSPHDRIFMGKGFFSTLKKERAKAGVKTEAITLDLPDAHHDAATDKLTLMRRTWLRPRDYTAAVEFDIYGDKVAIISFGEEAIATVIQSEQVAEAMRQLFTLLQVAARAKYPELN